MAFFLFLMSRFIGNLIASPLQCTEKIYISGVFTNFKAFLPEIYKKGLISTLLFRAYMINSSYHSLHKEVEELKKIFKRNAYPVSFIDKCVFRFFNKIHQKKVIVYHVDPPVSRFDFIHGEKRTHSNLQEQPSLLQIERDFQNFE